MITASSFSGYPADGRVRLVEKLTDNSGFYVCDNDPIYAETACDESRSVNAETACLRLNLSAKLRLVDNAYSGDKEECFDIIRLSSYGSPRELVSFLELCEMHATGVSSLTFEDFFYSLSELFQPNREQSKLNARGLFAELSIIDVLSTAYRDFDATCFWQTLGSRSKYDFSFPKGNLEVKSSTSEDPDVLIKHMQLFNDDENFLAVVSVERNPGGESVRQIALRLQQKHNCFLTLKSRIELEKRLLEVNETDLDMLFGVRYQRCYRAFDINPFEEVLDRVTNLQYRLNLSDLSYVDPAIALKLIFS